MSENNECSFCLEKINKSMNYTITECGHEFHTKCILNILQRYDNCPLCRKILINHISENSNSDNDSNDNIEWTIFHCFFLTCKVKCCRQP